MGKTKLEPHTSEQTVHNFLVYFHIKYEYVKEMMSQNWYFKIRAIREYVIKYIASDPTKL